MASTYSLSKTDKEKTKIQYSDLSPSLQAIIDSKVDSIKINELSDAIDKFNANRNRMVLTIGTSFPSNPTNNKNIHLNISNRVLYAYTNSSWKPTVMIPQG